MKASIALAAALAVALASPAFAQPKPQPGPAEAAPADDEEMVAMLREAVAEMRRAMYAPGPVVEGWNRGGGDPDAALRAAGADSHVFLLRSSDGPSVVMLARRPIADFAPEHWRVADSYGSSAAGLDNPFLQFTLLTPRYVLAVRANSRRVADVDCSDPVANAILYEVPNAPESAEDGEIPLFFRVALLASEDQIVCTRYDRDGAGWRPRAFLPDGRSLPQLDDESDRITIVPAAPLDTLLRRDPSSPA